MKNNEECNGVSHGIIIGRLFENWQKATSTGTALSDMVHQQPTTQLVTYNTEANRIINWMAKQKISWAIDLRFYWVRDRIQKNHFHIFWEERKKNLADYVKKHHLIRHHKEMRPRYVKATKKYIENSKDQRTGTGRGCAGTTNPWGTRKPDNPLEGIRNPIIWNLDNSLNGI